MLTRLSINNLATIASIAVEFNAGFTVLTGETGAGKSILIDALRFVLGGRAVGDQVRTGASQTLVEATFNIAARPEVCAALDELEIPQQGELTVRRLLSESGRTRALVNDCTLSQPRLEALGELLVNIHGQHDNQQLLQSATHVDFLDAFGGLETERGHVAKLHGEYAAVLRRRAETQARAGDRARRMEELTTAVAELDAAQLRAGEEEELRAEYAVLNHAERLGALLARCAELLYEGESPVLGALGEVAQALAEAAGVDPRLDAHREQIAPLRYQAEDLYQGLRTHAALVEADPARLEGLNTRLAELEKIKRRHGGKEGSIAAAIGLLEGAHAELEALREAEHDDESLDQRIAEVATQLHASSVRLSKARKGAALGLDKAVRAELEQLGMQRARFETRLELLVSPAGKTSYTAGGMERVEFLLSTNAGQEVRPLARIASGGELSRTMLALKTVLAQADPTHTLIFDEVDSGISGGVAEIVGRKLRELGETHQVLCVTHLPQIAALGRCHVLVSKTSENGQTFTQVAPLEGQHQVDEVARLLSGVDVTPHSLASAAEMISKGRSP